MFAKVMTIVIVIMIILAVVSVSGAIYSGIKENHQIKEFCVAHGHIDGRYAGSGVICYDETYYPNALYDKK